MRTTTHAIMWRGKNGRVINTKEHLAIFSQYYGCVNVRFWPFVPVNEAFNVAILNVSLAAEAAAQMLYS